MLERTQVFVDTSYLLASFYNSWEIGARAQLEIDLPEVVAVLKDMIQTQLGQPIQRQLWYDGIPDSGPHRYQRALRTCDGVQLRVGQLIEWGERRTQKAVDTRLVADMVMTGVRGRVSDIVLVSGDADMIPGVQEASDAGLRVHLYGFGWDSMSSALRHACDTTTILDPREDFADCMQLQVLEGPLPPVIRTKPIGDAEPIEGSGPEAVPRPVVGRPNGADTTDGGADSQGGEGDASAPAKHGDSLIDGEDCTTEAQSDTAATQGQRDGQGGGDPSARPGQAPKPGSEGSASAAPTPTDASRDRTSAAGHSGAGEKAVKPGDRQRSASEHASDSPVEREVAKTASTPTPGTVAAAAAEQAAKQEPGAGAGTGNASGGSGTGGSSPRPNPSMMAPRRKLRSRYVPLPNEVWASAGFQTPFDVGQQYASWWYDNAASNDQRDSAHMLSGGGLPPEVDRPLLQFACETLHEYTLTESQRVSLRDGFHSGIRGVLINLNKRG